MGEAVIVSVIEKLDNWLIKKADLRDDEREKLRSLVVEKADMCSVVVGMAEVLEDNKEMLYRLLVRVADPSLEDEEERVMNIEETNSSEEEEEEEERAMNIEETNNLEEEEEEERAMNIEETNSSEEEEEEEEEEERVMNIEETNSLEEEEEEETVEEKVIRIKEEKVSSLVFEMADLWEDDDNESVYQDTLQTLPFHMLHDQYYVYKKLYSLAIEMAEDGKGKLSKGKLYSWLAEKADLWDQNRLFHLLHELTTLPRRDEKHMKFRMTDVLKKVEEVKNDLMIILGIVRNTDKFEDLLYFISDAVEMAHDASLLIAVMDSDPFIFFLEIFNCFFTQQMSEDEVHPFTTFLVEISSIQKWIQETKERMVELGSAESQINNVGEELQLVDVVGLDEDVELMLPLIEDEFNNTTCIEGMIGIGKTTLARVLYNHPKIIYRFEGRAWVCLSSRKLSRKEVLINLIRQLLHNKEFQKDDDDVDDMLMKLEEADNISLRQMLYQQLRCKPYFIVLDDVSEDTYFKYFIKWSALPLYAVTHKGSRLLFTTRDKNISEMYGVENIHKMKNLDDDKSWQLLLKTALYGSSDDEKFPKQLERRGRHMLRKCCGLPLAIKEMGRQWAKKRLSESEWEEIVESSMDLDLSETLVALESTYLKLDPHVKSCFLRLAFFKEGTPIRRNKLEQILAVSGRRNEHMISLTKLGDESIIEVKQMNKFHYSDGAKTYRINDVFHMLSIRKAEDEIGFEIRKDGNNRTSHEPHHHRVIHCSRHNFNFNYSSMNQDKHLLSLFFHGGGFSDISTPSYWNHFELLKILDMEGFELKILPETVGELTELIYLGLRNNYIQELPSSLSRLKKLEVLDIALNFMVAVPNIIWEMDSLQHLYMSDIICQKSLKIDALRNLRTLTYISVDNWTYELSGLKMMTALCKLGIEEVDENTDVSKLFASLAQLDNIDSYSLILRGFRFRRLPSLDDLGILHRVEELKLEGRLTKLPTANNFPPNIIFVSLVNSCLDEDPMPILEKLPKLACLHLQNAYTGQQMVISPYGFAELFELVIEELWHLRNLQVGQHALQCLDRLEINSCPYLDTLQEEIYPTFAFPELKIVTTKNIATKIRESGIISRMNEVDIQP